MAHFCNDTLTWEGSFEEHLIYTPQKHPGFVAWVSAFDFGDGTVGLAFDERIQMPNPDFKNPKLEYYHCASLPVSYCSVEAGSADQKAFRVYLRSHDGIHFEETGRCARSEGSFCNLGFPGGRIIGLDVSRQNESRTGWSDFVQVRESLDGGNTWKPIRKLLDGYATYLWRARRLKDGSWIIIASFFGTPWGPGKQRPTRTASLPNETGISKIQTFFLTTRDGYSFSQPNYILPGIGAHEYDVVETATGDLLFIAGDVQGHPCGYQLVQRSPDGWINGTLFPIHAGAPKDVSSNPQGGYTPETIVYDGRHDCLLGYRRNNCFSLSNDNGENWTRILTDFSYDHLYQPQILPLPDGRVALYGHCGGGDSAFGENDMSIRAIIIDPVCADDLPKPTALAMDRMLSEDNSHYINAFRAKLTTGGAPVAGAQLEFRFKCFWDNDGSINTAPMEDAPIRITAVTDGNGVAVAHASMFDGQADIHFAYSVDAVFHGTDTMRGCASPNLNILALSPHRNCGFPRDAYMSGGCLYLSPRFMEDFPDAMEILRASVGDNCRFNESVLCPKAVDRLIESGALHRDQFGGLKWCPNVHAPRPLDDVKPMLSGDWYE